MSKVLHKCAVKATRQEASDIETPVNWAFSRRGFLNIKSDSLACGDWTVFYEDIDDAVLISIPWLFLKAYILKIKTSEKIYHFGLNPNSFWAKELPFSVKREAVDKKAGIIANVFRSIIFIWLFYALIKLVLTK